MDSSILQSESILLLSIVGGIAFFAYFYVRENYFLQPKSHVPARYLLASMSCELAAFFLALDEGWLEYRHPIFHPIFLLLLGLGILVNAILLAINIFSWTRP